MTRDHIVDILGQEVRVGDRVAAALTGGYSKAAKLAVGRVDKITAARTVIRIEKRSAPSYSDVSVVDDSLGRIVKMGEPE